MTTKTIPENSRDMIVAPISAGADHWGTEASAIAASALGQLPAAERIEQLFTSMKPERRLLLTIIDFCREPKAVVEVNAMVQEQVKDNRTVYSPGRLCTFLERAGALRRIGGDGSLEPERIELDGEEYWKPIIADATQWEATEDGIAACASDDPQARFRAVLEKDAQWAGAYLTVLDLCAAEGGASAQVLSAALDDHPDLQKPRRFAAYFYDQLDNCDCIRWSGSWTLTEVGRAAAEELRKEGIVAFTAE